MGKRRNHHLGLGLGIHRSRLRYRTASDQSRAACSSIVDKGSSPCRELLIEEPTTGHLGSDDDVERGTMALRHRTRELTRPTQVCTKFGARSAGRTRLCGTSDIAPLSIRANAQIRGSSAGTFTYNAMRLVECGCAERRIVRHCRGSGSLLGRGVGRLEFGVLMSEQWGFQLVRTLMISTLRPKDGIR